MFFGKDLLSKKEPIGLLWLAGTIGKRCKLTKKKILLVNIPALADEIISKGKKISSKTAKGDKDVVDFSAQSDLSGYSLRLSSTLLLGIVVIYNKRTQFLLSEGNIMIQRARQVHVALGSGDDNTVLDPSKRNIARFEAITMKTLDHSIEVIDPSLLLYDQEFVRNWYKLIGANDNGELIVSSLDQNTSTETISAFGFEVVDVNSNPFISNIVHHENPTNITGLALNDDIFTAGVDIFGQTNNSELVGITENAVDKSNLMNHSDIGGFDDGIGFVPDSIVPESNPKKRKRKDGHLIIDDEVQISSDNMRTMIEDCSALLNERPCCNETFNSSSMDEVLRHLGQGKIDKTTMDRLFYFIPCGYDPSNIQFNHDFEHVFMRNYKKVKIGPRPEEDQHNITLQQNTENNANNGIDFTDIGGFDLDIEHPRSDVNIVEAHDMDELASILLEESDLKTVISPTKGMNASFTAQHRSPEKQPLQPIDAADDLIQFLEDLHDEERKNNFNGNSMISKSWNMLAYLQKKSEEERHSRTDMNEKVFISFNKIIREGTTKNSKRLKYKAAQGFYQLLVLASNGHIEIESLDRIFVHSTMV
nr:unnamed protein product [Naegleria fowleri]